MHSSPTHPATHYPTLFLLVQAATMANGVSSRSHAVLQLSLCRPATGRPAGRMVGRAAALAAAAGDEPKAYDE
eukprot:scaffold28167_cov45-Isochrysis_galbana.AAC.1